MIYKLPKGEFVIRILDRMVNVSGLVEVPRVIMGPDVWTTGDDGVRFRTHHYGDSMRLHDVRVRRLVDESIEFDIPVGLEVDPDRVKFAASANGVNEVWLVPVPTPPDPIPASKV